AGWPAQAPHTMTCCRTCSARRSRQTPTVRWCRRSQAWPDAAPERPLGSPRGALTSWLHRLPLPKPRSPVWPLGLSLVRWSPDPPRPYPLPSRRYSLAPYFRAPYFRTPYFGTPYFGTPYFGTPCPLPLASGLELASRVSAASSCEASLGRGAPLL